MNVEIERRFLVAGDGWRGGADGTRLVQGYLAADAERSVRVRLTPDRAWLTVKGRTVGSARPEFEYPIPRADAEALLDLCLGTVEKTRHRVAAGAAGLVWEIDEFAGANAGLVLAEIELRRADQDFPRPDWLGDEVTGDPRYANARLALAPWTTWDGAAGPAEE